MPDHDDSGWPDNGTSSGAEVQQGLSRRSVLWGAAGAGAAGIAATAFIGSAGHPATPAEPETRGAATPAADAATTDQIVVHVRDARSGEIDVFRGTSQTRLHDPELAARLVRASR
jgi:hypothetical protein